MSAPKFAKGDRVVYIIYGKPVTILDIWWDGADYRYEVRLNVRNHLAGVYTVRESNLMGLS